MDLQTIIVIVVGLAILGVVWKLIKGTIKLVVMLAVVAVIGFVLFGYLG